MPRRARVNPGQRYYTPDAAPRPVPEPDPGSPSEKNLGRRAIRAVRGSSAAATTAVQ